MKYLKLCGQTSLAAFILVITATCSTLATVAPSLEDLSRKSDIIAVGTVIEVENPGATVRQIKIDIKEFIRFRPWRPLVIEKLTFTYRVIQGGDLSFQRMKEDAGEHVFFLRYVPDSVIEGEALSFHVELADAWFGVKTSQKENTSELKNIEAKIDILYNEIETARLIEWKEKQKQRKMKLKKENSKNPPSIIIKT